LSLTRCARLAGVSAATITGWLLAEGIRIRSNGEQQALNHVRQGWESVAGEDRADGGWADAPSP
jgi:hypothetical protein